MRRQALSHRSTRRAGAGAAVAAAVALVLSPAVPSPAVAGGHPHLTAFEQGFLHANANGDAQPFMRWWIAPGRMNEAEVRREIKSFADGGYAGVELQSLELAKDCVINDPTWNETMTWILRAGIDYGVQIDMTIGQMWPIATPEITDVDDTRAEQRIRSQGADFTATADAMAYTADAYVFPPAGSPWRPGFDPSRAWELIAVTAAEKLDDGTYDSATAVNVLDDGATFDPATGAISWTAPSEGDWTVFYFYRQSSGNQVRFGVDQYVVDHMSKAATDAVTQTWEDAMNSDPELKALYEENAGSMFGDSFELSSDLWTLNMLDEFKARRGYDLTPYLPALSETFSVIGDRVRNDLHTTMTELLAENHMGELDAWAATHHMTLRYQAYSSAGSSVFELTEPALATDIIEVESYAMGAAVPDTYRQLSGAVNMRGDTLFSAEAAETSQDDWRETWTDTQLESGSANHYAGFMHYANRLFAAGVNKMVFHGTTYKFTDGSDNPFSPAGYDITWPGYAAMSALHYGNEWDDRTPMWDNVDIMTDALSRTQFVLQQGQGDVDLAFYRFQFGKGSTQSDITPVEEAGYTYDYVTPTVLDLPNAVVSGRHGARVLAADGPSYKALVIEPLRADGTASQMSLDMARKVLGYAKAGLPVVIVGEAPSRVISYPGDDSDVGSAAALEAADATLADYMTRLAQMRNVRSVADRAGAVAALAELGVTPDAQPSAPSSLYVNHRETSTADLYYLYNDGDEAATESVTLDGRGAPYLLDPWSGEVTPIAQYTVAGGKVTIGIDLASQDAMMVAVARPGFSSARNIATPVVSTDADAAVYEPSASGVALRSAEGGRLHATLSNGRTVSVRAAAAEAPMALADWSMVLNQWTEGESVHDTLVVPTDSYDLSATGLVPWYAIDAENLTNVGGVADYTTSFELAKGWAQGQGAYLQFTDVADVGRLLVNGVEVPMNQLSLKVDIGKYLVPGTNTLVVKVSSNLANVKYGTSDSNTYAFGVIGDVTLTPYTQVSLTQRPVSRPIPWHHYRPGGHLPCVSHGLLRFV